MDLKLCRLCCENKGCIDIFSDDSNELSPCAKIMYCSSKINIIEGDGLPLHICISCEAELAAAYQFVLKCEATDKTLHSLEVKLTPKYEWNQNIDVKIENSNISEHEYEESRDDFDTSNETQEIKFNSNTELIKPKQKTCKKRIKYKKPGTCKCSVCGRKCANPSTLSIHMRSHSNEKPFACRSCDKKYKDSGTLKRHVERNHLENRERNFICETCGKDFFSKTDVKIHMRTHTGETPYACTECPLRFTQLSAMLRHKRRHAGVKSYICQTCNKAFCTKEELKNHQTVHTSIKEYTCPICNVLFKYQNNLKKHLRLHTELTRFICNYCGRTFNVKGNLKMHIKRQHSEKSGYCNVCAKDVSNIEVHMWRHTGERPLKCELCTSSFYELKGLTRHINFRHKKTDKYKCLADGCLMAFPSRPMLDFHTAKLHSTHIPFPCDRCSRGFYRKNDLSRHKLGTHIRKDVHI